MSRQLSSDLMGIFKGIQMVASEGLKLQENTVKYCWSTSSLRTTLGEVKTSVGAKVGNEKGLSSMGKFFSEALQRSSMVPGGIRAFAGQLQVKVEMKELELLDYDADTIYESMLVQGELDKLNEQNLLQLKALETVPLAQSPQLTAPTATRLDEKISQVNYSAVKPSKTHDPQTSSSSGKSNNSNVTPEEPKPGQAPFAVDKAKSSAPVASNRLQSEGSGDTTKKAKKIQKLSETAKERKVPATRLGRLFSFGSLAAGLGIGTMAEMTRRTLGKSETQDDSLSSMFLTPANAERIVNTLCKVRGAALKLGQILSIQDNNVISPVLQQAFERVRQSADFMPQSQVEGVMSGEFGTAWQCKFDLFDMTPFAAASIGQVHLAKLPNGMDVAVKIQYPGVAKGIDSDIENLVSIMKIWNIFPEGLFIDKIIEVAKWELSREVDYEHEAVATKKFRDLLKPHPQFYVPQVIDELSTKQILTTELIEGVPVDKCADMDVTEREHICHLIMQLCLWELFEWQYMQTDPNWSNFFYNPDTKQLILLDFGASRSYDKPFLDKYLRVIKAASEKDRKQVLEISRDMGFLTGFESKAMENAHVDTIMILGEVFNEDKEVFDFSMQDTVKRVTQLVPTIVNHRLCPPPDEIYSLHRKLSGVFLLCAKLKVKMKCRDMFNKVYSEYVFG